MVSTPKLQQNRKKKSEKVSNAIIRDLKKYVQQVGTITDAAENIGIGRVALGMIIGNRGTAKTDTLIKIKKVLYESWES